MASLLSALTGAFRRKIASNPPTRNGVRFLASALSFAKSPTKSTPAQLDGKDEADFSR
jgi:hypothetical protein